MGLGGYPDVTLAGARDSAREARAKIAGGVDPIADARATRSALAASLATAWTFSECSAAFIKAKSPEWANAKHAAQWPSTLATYADPVIGRLLVKDVDTPHILAILEPIWLTKTETAARVRSRVENVLDWAIARGYRSQPNPARWKGHLAHMLATPKKATRVQHHPALPVEGIGSFMAALRLADGTGARALEFAVLTAARSGEVRGATWDEINLDDRVWTIPGERMKMKREHRVPLSPAVLKLLRTLPRDSELLFPSPTGLRLSDMTLSAVMRRMGADAVPHGLRSTFRDWAAEETSYPNHVVEQALAHAISDRVEAAYRRGDLFKKRRALMEDWAKFCSRVYSKDSKVARLRLA